MRILRNLLGSVLVLSLLALPACDDDGGDSDAGIPDGGTDVVQDVALECNSACFTPYPSVTNNPRPALQEVHYNNENIVVLRNRTQAELTMTGWSICEGTTCQPIPDSGTAPDNAEITFYMGASGTDTATERYIPTWPDLTRNGEIAIFSGTDPDAGADLVGYVRWGQTSVANSRESLAISTGDWEGGFIHTCDEHVRVVAVGNVALLRGWKALVATCP